jgi:hypothetical protein
MFRNQPFLCVAYNQQQSELAREFMSFAHAQDDPIVGKEIPGTLDILCLDTY